MKTTTLLKVLTLVTIATSLWSCSNGSKSGGVVVVPGASSITDTTTYGNGYNQSTWPADGSTAAFVPRNFSTMMAWVGLHPLNDPQNYRIRVQLQKVYKRDNNGNITAGPYYAGSVQIGYTDTGVWYESYMSAGSGTNIQCSGCNDNNELESKYNYFYRQTSDNQIVFSGFFQDQYGAVVLALQNESGGADAEGGGTWKGKLYYKNFSQSLNAQSPYRKCWFITAGPYACNSTTVQNKSSIDSIANYEYLGSFSGLNKNAVLGL